VKSVEELQARVSELEAENAMLREALEELAKYRSKMLTNISNLAGRPRDINKRNGAIRFGMRLSADGVHIEPDLIEHAAIERVCELRLKEGLGKKSIADRMNSEGIHKCRSAKWHTSLVLRILQRHMPGPLSDDQLSKLQSDRLTRIREINTLRLRRKNAK
jgi:predicted nuclease with TOPRIM domain